VAANGFDAGTDGVLTHNLPSANSYWGTFSGF
jgi:hypothetical protein